MQKYETFFNYQSFFTVFFQKNNIFLFKYKIEHHFDGKKREMRSRQFEGEELAARRRGTACSLVASSKHVFFNYSQKNLLISEIMLIFAPL